MPCLMHGKRNYTGAGGGASALNDLTDVTVNNPSNNQVLKYDESEQKWVNGTGGGGASTMSDLADVEIDAQTLDAGQVLKWDDVNEKWVNEDEAGGTTSVELTNAQYQALTPEQKNDPTKVYYVTDYPSGGGGGADPFANDAVLLNFGSCSASGLTYLTLDDDFTDYHYISIMFMNGDKDIEQQIMIPSEMLYGESGTTDIRNVRYYSVSDSDRSAFLGYNEYRDQLYVSNGFLFMIYVTIIGIGKKQ